MSRDVRELILARIFTEVQQVPGFVKYYRNRGDVPPKDPDTDADLLPAIICLDGTEKVAVAPRLVQGRQTAAIMQVEPQIFIALKPAVNLSNDQVGQELNTFRMAVLKQILSSESLMALLGSNGGMFYQGCITDLQNGSTIEGNMQINLAMQYVFNPEDLV